MLPSELLGRSGRAAVIGPVALIPRGLNGCTRLSMATLVLIVLIPPGMQEQDLRGCTLGSETLK